MTYIFVNTSIIFVVYHLFLYSIFCQVSNGKTLSKGTPFDEPEKCSGFFRLKMG